MVTPRKPSSPRSHNGNTSSGGGRSGRQGQGRGREEQGRSEGYGRGEARSGGGRGQDAGGYGRGTGQGGAEGGYRDRGGNAGGQNQRRSGAFGNDASGSGGRFNVERNTRGEGGYQKQNHVEGGGRGHGGNFNRDDSQQGRGHGEGGRGRFGVERGEGGAGRQGQFEQGGRGRGGNFNRDDSQQGRGYGEGGRGRFGVERGEGGAGRQGQFEQGGRGRGGNFNRDDSQQGRGYGEGGRSRFGNERNEAGYARDGQSERSQGRGGNFNRDGARQERGYGSGEGTGRGPRVERPPREGQGEGNRRRDAEGSYGREERQPRVGQGEGQRRHGAEGGYGRGDARRPHAPAQPPVERAKKMRQRRGSEEHKAITQQLREKRVEDKFVGELRIQKALALSGVGSRRDCDVWVAEGRVSVNGHVVEPGARVKPGDMVRFDGKPLDIKWPDRLPRIVLYHKQEGELVSRDDPEGRTTVFERLPKVQSSAWVAVGRLDFNTSGLLIFTTSGDLANRLMHPRFEVEREYAVRLLGALTDEQAAQLRQGIQLEDGEARFDVLEDQGGEGKNHWYRVILREGRNREVRRMFEHFELQVSRLMRVRFGAITLPSRLKRGQYYELDETEVLSVLKWAGLGMTGRVGSRR